MKKIIIFSTLCASLFLGSCSSSFLDQEPPLYVNENDIFTSPTRIEATLNGLYAAIKNTGTKSLMGGKSYMVFDNRGDDVINISNNLVTLFNTYNMNVGITDAENADTWTYAYLAINKVNTFLQSLEGAKEVAGENYDRYVQEAKFVRALAYYYLNNLYPTPYSVNPDAKSVPLRLTAEAGTENNNMPRSTVKQIYDHILSDLENISALNTEVNTYAGVTHATQAAANMLKMRVYMAMNEWDKAIAAGELVTGYSLPEDVTLIYKAPYFSQESIFSLPMADTNIPNTQQSLAEYYYDGKIMLIDTKSGIMSKPDYSLATDKRIIAFKGEKDLLLKFTDAKTKLQWVPIFRYAETLLDLAECYANKAGGEATAKSLLKQVRGRSVDAATDPLKIENLTGDALKEAIYNEKRLEFIGEGIRGIDIMRRGERFIKVGANETINVGPSDEKYTWPIPQVELLLNKDINK